MEIAAVQWTSLQDFPGRVAAVVWVPGCNLRCPFCYNAELVVSASRSGITGHAPDQVLDKLKGRRGFLDGVVITGGEPTLQPNLADFLRQLRELGLAAKVDTNGTRPSALRELVKQSLVDYVAMDIKAPPDRYMYYAAPPHMDERELLSAIEESLEVLRMSSVDYELRTTVAPGLTGEDLRKIARWIAPARRYLLQPFVVPPESKLIEEGLRHADTLPTDRLDQLAAELCSVLPTSARI